MKIRLSLPLALFSVLILAGCGPVVSASSGEVSSSESVASSSSAPELALTQSVASFLVGQSYLSQEQVTLTYGGNDVSGKTDRWSISLSKGSKTYDGWDAIDEAGTYEVTASYRLSNTLSVRSGALSVAVEERDIPSDKGYAEPVDYFSDNDTIYYLEGNNGNNCLKSTGTQRILVVPIQFSDSPFSEDQLTKIEKAFFGQAAETSWQSLASFYDTSSYGRLNLTGVVTSPFDALALDGSPVTASAFGAITAEEALTGDDLATFKDYWNISWLALEEATKAIGEGSLLASDGSPIDLQDYDGDGDGFIDGVWMIYSYPYSTSNTSAWWAWTHHDYTKQEKGNVEEPVGYALCWASYSFISQGRYSDGIDIDAHTLIHETGHLMGLNDYYSTDEASAGKYEGVEGGIDMMDLNVGDHHAYSKMLLNWVRPYYADGTEEAFAITLRPFEETGDSLLLKSVGDSWNQTPFDEYMTFEYYTPTGLNEKDSAGYPEWKDKNIGTYDRPGVLAHHVDARLINEKATGLDEDGNVLYDIGYVDHIAPNNFEEGLDYSYTMMGASNTPSRTAFLDENGNYKSGAGVAVRETSLIPSCAKNIFQNQKDNDALMSRYSIDAEDDVLFDESVTTFSVGRCAPCFTTYPGKMNDGSEFGWTVSVKSMTADGVTLIVAKD